MTGTDDVRRVDSGRVDDGYRQWPQVLLTLIVGVLLGALVGAGYGSSRPVTHQAGIALSVLPDPTVDITSQNNNQSGTPALDATAYIQSQLVIINGRQLADQVRTSLGLSSLPSITATQVGQTYVVQIATSAGSAARASTIARTTGARYVALRTEQLRTEVDGLLSSTNQQLTAVSRSLSSSQRGQSSTASATPSQTALQTEYERLLSVRSTLNAVLEQSDRVVTVVSPARATSSGLSATAKDALAGAVFGAVVALVVFFALRRSRHRVRNLTDLAELDVPVLLPVLPRPSLSAMRSGAVHAGTEARILASRLGAEAGGERRPLVFVGATAGPGAASVSATVAAALAGSAPVLLVQTGGRFPTGGDPWAVTDPDPLSGVEHAGVVASAIAGVWLLEDTGSLTTRRLRTLLGEAPLLGWHVVVEAGAVSQADVALACARAGAAVVLVVDRGRATPAAALAATELFEATGTGLLGVVLNDPAGALGKRVHGKAVAEPSPSAGRHTEPSSLSSVAAPGESPIPAPRPAAAHNGSDGAGLVQRTVR